MVVSLLGMVYQATNLPPPSTTDIDCDDNSTVASQRIRLSDGRYLAYVEKGVPKNESNFRIVVVHGFGSSKEMHFLAPQVLTLNSLLFTQFNTHRVKICTLSSG